MIVILKMTPMIDNGNDDNDDDHDFYHDDDNVD